MDENDQKRIQAEARLMALEYQLAHVYNMLLKAFGADEASIATSERQGIMRMDLQATGIADPAMSDHMLGEVQDALLRLQVAARTMRA